MTDARNPDVLEVVRLRPTDAARCLALSTEAGWNQTTDDWQFHARIGKAIGLETPEGDLIATGVTLPAAPDVGWIAMILVATPWRGRGVGRRVMQTLLNDPSYSGFALDATELGLPLYQRLGFREMETIQRFRFDGGVSRQPHGLPEPKVRTPFEYVAAQLAMREDVRIVRSGTAFGLVRPGREKVHIGPIRSNSEADAYDLVKSVLESTAEGVLVDVPVRAGTFCRRLETLGFEPTRAFVRMSLGCSFLVSSGLFAIAGPEFS